jgi:hypothetical protein
VVSVKEKTPSQPDTTSMTRESPNVRPSFFTGAID